jgi:glycosyltransferase involved in cell wall biosynthesis
MTKQPSTQALVSVIVPTRNSSATLKACLASIHDQTYPNLELIVVDRDSTDPTTAIANEFTKHVYNYGRERSSQRNFGIARASGKYLFIVDSDMELTPSVVADCLQRMESNPQIIAISIPETSFGQGFWARCKALERSYYPGVDWMELPRFMLKETYEKSGGYDETVVGGEDWDLTQRLRLLGAFGNISSLIHHNEGHLRLSYLLSKRYRLYGEGMARQGQANHFADGPRLLALFFSRPLIIIQRPITWGGMMTMKLAEFSARTLGAVSAKRNREKMGRNR